MSLPKVSTPANQEVKLVSETIAKIEEYKSKNWAIGLNGDTFQPDAFLAFFTQRDLSFEFYVVNDGVSIGAPSAYENNTNVLHSYTSKVVESEKLACTKIINELNTYKENFWAIGLNGDTLQPDNFNAFYASREVEFLPFVRSKGVSIGEDSAYDKNIEALKMYISELEKYATVAA